MAQDVYNNNDVQYDSYLEPEIDPFIQQILASTAITSINGITGPTVTFAGGTSGFSYAPGGTTLTLVSPLTAKGDLYTHSSTAGVALAVGTNGFVLSANSGTATGLEWIANAVGTVTSVSVVTANGFSGTVATPTTTPAITLNNPTALVCTTSVTAPVVLVGSGTGALQIDLAVNGASATVGAQLKNTGSNAADDVQISFLTQASRTVCLGLDRSAGLFTFTPNSVVLGGAGSTTFDAITGAVVMPNSVTIGAGSPITSSGAGGALGTAAFISSTAGGDLSGTLPSPTVAKINGVTLGTTTATSGNILIGSGSQWATQAVSGDATLSNVGALTLASVITAGGPIGSATVTPIITYDAKGRLTTVTSATITPAVGSITGLGTGVATALAVNTGTAGAFVVNGGALGTPLSGVGTNLTGIPLTTGITGTLGAANGGTGVANNAASTITISGNFATTLTVTNTTSVTLPTTGTLATLAGSEELTNKTLNASVGKGTWTASGTWTLPAVTLGGAITYGGVTLSNAVTGTGNMVLSASPTFTGTLAAATVTVSTDLSVQAATADVDFTSTTGNNYVTLRAVNTGGTVFVGQDSSTGGSLATGSAAFSAVLTHSGAHSLHLGTNSTVRLTIDSSGATTILNLAGTGSRTVLADANGLLSAPVSDARLKTNIRPIQTALDKVSQMRGVGFDFIPTEGVALSFDKRPQIGMIADEVEKVIPEAVGFNAPVNGTAYRYLNYDTLVPVLIEAIKELRREVEMLKANEQI